MDTRPTPRIALRLFSTGRCINWPGISVHALAQPGVAMKDVSIDGRMLELIYRSSLLKFPSRISVMFMPLGEGRSTLAIYSRSQYGRRSTNRMRIDDWLAAIGAPEDTEEIDLTHRAESPASA